jgi:hypothetical protein
MRLGQRCQVSAQMRRTKATLVEVVTHALGQAPHGHCEHSRHLLLMHCQLSLLGQCCPLNTKHLRQESRVEVVVHCLEQLYHCSHSHRWRLMHCQLMLLGQRCRRSPKRPTKATLVEVVTHALGQAHHGRCEHSRRWLLIRCQRMLLGQHCQVCAHMRQTKATLVKVVAHALGQT